MVLFILFGCAFGLFLGGFLSKIVIPPWQKNDIYSNLPRIDKVLYVSYWDTTNENVLQDTILVEAVNGELFRLNQNEAIQIDPIPEEVTDYEFRELYSNSFAIFTKNDEEMYELVGREWMQQAPTDKTYTIGNYPCNEWNIKPPIGWNYKDTNGVIYERPISTFYRCYVVTEDGKLHVWLKFQFVGILLPTLGISALLGMIIFGFIGKIFVKRISESIPLHESKTAYR